MYDEKYELDFGKLVSAVGRFKKTGIFTGLVVMGAVVFGNEIIFPDQYEASALVRVKTNEAIQSDNRRNNMVQVVQEEILSRTILESVVKQLGMNQPHTGNKTLGQKVVELFTGRETAIKPESMDNIVRDLRSDVQVVETASGQRGTSLFTVSMKADNADTAANVVNAVVSTYIGQKTANTVVDSKQAVEFLTAQTTNKKQDLLVITKKLELYKGANNKYLVTEGGISQALYDAKMRLAAAEGRLVQANAMTANTQVAMENLPATLVSRGASRNLDSTQIPVDPLERLVFMEQRLADFNARYTPDHPDVVRAGREVARLRSAVGDNERTTLNVVSSSNPEYLRLQNELSAAKATRQSAVSEVVLIKREIAHLNEVSTKLPQVQQILATLETTRDAAQRELQNLQNRLTEAMLSSQAAHTDVGSNFMIVDPAVAPMSPTVRSRLVLHLLGVMMGLGIGFGVSLVFGLMIPEKTDETNVIVGEDGEVRVLDVRTVTAGDVMFYVSASLVFVAIAGYIVVGFLTQSVMFVQ